MGKQVKIFAWNYLIFLLLFINTDQCSVITLGKLQLQICLPASVTGFIEVESLCLCVFNV